MLIKKNLKSKKGGNPRENKKGAVIENTIIEVVTKTEITIGTSKVETEIIITGMAATEVAIEGMITEIEMVEITTVITEVIGHQNK